MIDEDLRRLERRAKETLSPFDQASSLRARVRSGELEAARLDLAAFLGYEAATIASGRQPPTPPTDWAHLRSWGARLSTYGREAALRAGLSDAERSVRVIRSAAARTVRPPLKEHLEVHARVALSRIDALTAWVLLPGAAVRQDLGRLTRDKRLEVPPIEPRALTKAGLSAQEVAIACSQALLATSVLADSIIDGRSFVVGEWWPSQGDLGLVPKIRSAIRREVAPWALGLEDPLAKRASTVLDRLEIASPCSQSWEKLVPAPDGRSLWCEKCRLSVFDLSALSRDEALALLRERDGERVCVRLYRRPDGRVMTRDCLSGQQDRAKALPLPPRPQVLGGLFGGLYASYARREKGADRTPQSATQASRNHTGRKEQES